MKIICVGRNYVEHAKELHNEVPREPILFLKPETSLLRPHLPFFYPDFSSNIHYEVELVLRICKLGKNIQSKFASNYYDKIGLGLDFTARDLQDELKTKGLPWEKAKAFDGSAFVSDFFDISDFKNPEDINFSLQKNGKAVQNGNSKNMIFNFNDLIAEISKYFTLKIGDMIFTGTPAGVGPVSINDELEGFLDNQAVFKLKIK